ncbi:hypothetical protein T11_9066 [Trichinella zimbabwensis]|uniref:Uncharacterized protein n=1 Tax=Trichinella zimbabwensis TaxID=268475 RepID=A0A0V1HR74_9BILA|nr:hypothetical protein T11_9066 [Trichinella zimbabwensis]
MSTSRARKTAANFSKTVVDKISTPASVEYQSLPVKSLKGLANGGKSVFKANRLRGCPKLSEKDQKSKV